MISDLNIFLSKTMTITLTYQHQFPYSDRMKMVMIVAMDEDCNIGSSGELPWRLKSDMIRFKSLTEGDGFNSVIMGRKTWDSLPADFTPLPDRTNIVMSRDTNWYADGAVTALYVGRAIEIALADGCDECWVIGGSQIYEMFLERVEEIHVTKVHVGGSGNVSFPVWNKINWSEEVIEHVPEDAHNEHATTYSVWTKN
ncbi:MAG TPA: hypothetical protein EYQ11_04955 [Candidatus Poseidoniales archaeon]|nr:MAG: hypothetical protein CXT66_03390 [Euryarchaeota archaeon]HIG34205.1 hypothetical protein [Candidatus Poseidoniales archaeon]